MKKIASVTVILFTLTFACGFLPPEASPAPTLTMAPPTETSTPTAAPLETQPPSLETQPPDVGPECVQPGAHQPLVDTNFEFYPELIVEFLNTGGSEEELALSLEALGIASPPTAVIVGELSGDDRTDVVVALLDPDSQTVPNPGLLLIYVCQDGQYALLHTGLSPELFSSPEILSIQDMNADGIGDVIYSSTTCGAHTCFEDVQILSWNGANFSPRLEGTSRDLPYPELQITDYDQDGIYNLEISGTGIGSVGAGPQRSLTRIWEYFPERGVWMPVQENLGPSNYRIHSLHDADSALGNGEYEIAALLYGQVINNPALEDWADPETERLNLSAFARYKLIVVYSLQGNLEQAMQTLAEMDQLFPFGLPRHAFVEMAEVFLAGFAAGGIELGCEAASNYAADNEEIILTPLGSSSFGYANKDYAPEDVCA
ncbi:MAG: hypothetical protein FVQ83_06910 [Chloroflexi bacterium]|nr:hypothetical protein [Chloroflexota bacterium]